ncbi:hypothetical protein BSPWISOXPB_672 [uncultured Gammaproteobacteria bacterium]|nr:hypothetical protein BSPWISOXPB_672 [uncultured Gammaproteobacteria bacterium]
MSTIAMQSVIVYPQYYLFSKDEVLVYLKSHPKYTIELLKINHCASTRFKAVK